MNEAIAVVALTVVGAIAAVVRSAFLSEKMVAERLRASPVVPQQHTIVSVNVTGTSFFIIPDRCQSLQFAHPEPPKFEFSLRSVQIKWRKHGMNDRVVMSRAHFYRESINRLYWPDHSQLIPVNTVLFSKMCLNN